MSTSHSGLRRVGGTTAEKKKNSIIRASRTKSNYGNQACSSSASPPMRTLGVSWHWSAPLSHTLKLTLQWWVARCLSTKCCQINVCINRNHSRVIHSWRIWLGRWRNVNDWMKRRHVCCAPEMKKEPVSLHVADGRKFPAGLMQWVVFFQGELSVSFKPPCWFVMMRLWRQRLGGCNPTHNKD